MLLLFFSSSHVDEMAVLKSVTILAKTDYENLSEFCHEGRGKDNLCGTK